MKSIWTIWYLALQTDSWLFEVMWYKDKLFTCHVHGCTFAGAVSWGHFQIKECGKDQSVADTEKDQNTGLVIPRQGFLLVCVW